MKTAAARYIDMTKENRERLARAFSCTGRFIVKALTYDSDTELAERVRNTAIREYRGRKMLHVPECETFHDTMEDGREIMRQTFDNGAVLRADKRTGEAWVTDRKGVTVERRERVGIPELTELQLIAKNL